MDIIVPDIWLREYLKTNATPKQIADCLALCGPSVERIKGDLQSLVYLIEVTTNRVDSASVYGIAREAAAILPRFKIKTKLRPLKTNLKQTFSKKVKYLKVSVDHKLCPRFSAVLIKNVKVQPSPKDICDKLILSGERPINNCVDISNFVMHELGQPVHTFDWDKIEKRKMILRESKPGEKITTLDGKSFTLPGGDIVIEDGSGKLIDLAGIMGGENSCVDQNTVNVLVFIQNYSPYHIRRTSMNLSQRSHAATLFEKGIDSEQVELAMTRVIDLFEKITGGKAEKQILDLYPKPYKPKSIKVSLDFIEERLGINIDPNEVTNILNSLSFKTIYKNKIFNIQIPSFRSSDISIGEDIVEEVARMYGYFNLPVKLMSGDIPHKPATSFEFENKIKYTLKGFGGIEVYTSSLVPSKEEKGRALKLKNPLSADSVCMRTSMRYSMINAAEINLGTEEPYFLFEISNVYEPKSNSLPLEKLKLSIIFVNFNFRDAKGIVEGLFEEFGIKTKIKVEDWAGFVPNKRLSIGKSGEFGVLENEAHYFEMAIDELRLLASPIKKFTPIPKYPPQIEDMTLNVPPRTVISELISEIKLSSTEISNVTLMDIYKDEKYTFKIKYQSQNKTLENQDVERIRGKILENINKKFSVTVG